MTHAMSKALEQLNTATGATYSITSAGGSYTLNMPNGGSYPACDAIAMVRRLITLTNAANGRMATRFVA